jgi:uncharacterized protein (TIGR02217 family)
MAHSFDAILFPPGYAYGFTGGPSFDTRITRMDGGGEQRVQMREEPLWRWSGVRQNFRDGADVNGLVDWFLARRGAQFGFLFLDARDFSTAEDHTGAPSANDQVIGFGDGTTTRFRLRKQYTDPGGMTARTFPRRVVPLLGTASAPVARLIGVNAGASIAPAAAVDGVVDVGATFLQLSQEVELSAPPAIGAQVTWGGYFAVPARFGESTDQGLEATIAGFQSDEAPFEVESIPFDDPVPLVPGGSPYGHVLLASQTTSFELSARRAFYFEVDADAPINGYLDDLNNYPTGGPHLFVVNTGGSTITVRDSLGASVGTITATNSKWLFVKEDASGNRTPVLL